MITTKKGELSPAYGPVMGVATAIIAIGIAVTTALGPEKKGRHFEEAGPIGAQNLTTAKDIEAGSVHSGEKDSVKAVELVDSDSNEKMQSEKV